MKTKKNVKQFAFGGNTLINAEKNEILQTPQGQVANINGATHEQGGVDLNVPNGSLIFSDRIGIKNDKGKFMSLADRKKIRENTLMKLNKRQKDPFQINTAQRMGERLAKEEQTDVALQTMVRNQIEGNTQDTNIPKAAFGTGDYISTGASAAGSIVNLINTIGGANKTKPALRMTQNLNTNYGINGLEKIRSTSEDLKTQGTYTQNLLNSQLQQGKQDATAAIDSSGGSINLRRALRSDLSNKTNQVFGDTLTKLNANVLGEQSKLGLAESEILNQRDAQIASGEAAKLNFNQNALQYDQAVERSNTQASNAATNDIFSSISGIGNKMQYNDLMDKYLKISSAGGKLPALPEHKYGGIVKKKDKFALGGEVEEESIEVDPDTVNYKDFDMLNLDIIPSSKPIRNNYTSKNVDLNRILSTIKKVESTNNYTSQNPSSSASGAYGFIDNTWKSLTNKYGIGKQYERAVHAPSHIQDKVAQLYVNESLKQVGGDIKKLPLIWYTGDPTGKISNKALAVNKGLTPQRYQSKWLNTLYNGG